MHSYQARSPPYRSLPNSDTTTYLQGIPRRPTPRTRTRSTCGFQAHTRSPPTYSNSTCTDQVQALSVFGLPSPIFLPSLLLPGLPYERVFVQLWKTCLPVNATKLFFWLSFDLIRRHRPGLRFQAARCSTKLRTSAYSALTLWTAASDWSPAGEWPRRDIEVSGLGPSFIAGIGLYLSTTTDLPNGVSLRYRGEKNAPTALLYTGGLLISTNAK